MKEYYEVREEFIVTSVLENEEKAIQKIMKKQ